MKKAIFSLALLLTCSILGYAQKGISYQAVILDPKPIEIPGQDITGQPFMNGEVSLKFKIFSSTFVQEFEEVHVAKTDGYGLVNVLIGSTSPAAFASLIWDSNPKNMQVWVSFDQGGTYTKVSEQVLTYNPYAIYAETAGKLGGTLGIAAGGTGATTAAGARTNLGLGNVDNTADANKPISTATQAALDTKANASDVTTALATKANANEVTTALATKANSAEVTTALATKANASDVTTSLALKEDASNKVNTPLGSSTTLFPTQNAVKTYVDAQVAGATIADASSSTKGKIQLAGDLAGTAAAPTVPGLAAKANASDVTTSLALKEDVSNKSNTPLGTSTSLYPTQNAVKTYVDAQVAAATIPDANSITKGKIQLTGDLGGTAAAPTVPGLVAKADAAAVTTALAQKAPLASPTFTGTVAVGTASPSPAAVLDLTSTSKGLLLPRLTFVQRSSIVSPEAGLILWCTDCGANGELQVYNGTNFENMVGANVQFALPTISATSAATAITSSSFTTGGSIESDGGALVTARGVVWNTNTNPTISLTTKTSDGTGIGNFSSSVTGLTSGVTYYVRAYATNSVGTKYGPEITVNSAQAVATLATTTAASSITITSAISGGNITYNGGATVTASGVVWSTSASPTVELSTKTTDGTANGTFTSSITSLSPGTLYYVRSYATNSVGTSYGEQISFNSATPLTLAATTAASSIANTTATSGGDISSDGGSAVTARGIVWGTTTNPTTALTTKTTDGTGTGTFTSSLTGLTPATTYYVRSYATNAIGTVYGAEISFTTATNGLLLNLDAANPSSYSGTGITWNDLSGNNNHGTLLANNSGSLPVFQNGSLYFDGSTSYSYVSIASSVIPNSGSWTLSTWAKSPSGGFSEMINTRDASSITGFLLTSRGNGIRTQLNNPGVQQFEPNSNSTTMDNTWHLITITVDVSSNQMKWYVDDNLVNTINFSAGSLTGQGNFVIGWDYAWNAGGAEYFRGNISTVTVYNFVLSSSDISTNFNAAKSRFAR